MPLPAHAAILELTAPTGRYKFLLPEKLSGFFTYMAVYDEITMVNTGELFVAGDQPALLWNRGKDEPVSLSLRLVVGLSEGIDTPEDLMRVLTEIIRLSLPGPGTGKPGGQTPPNRVQLHIGTWFAREAIVKSVRVDELQRPWDPETGLPYVADLTVELQYVYEDLPSNEDFTFAPGG